MSQQDERLEVVKETLREQEKLLGLKNGELLEIYKLEEGAMYNEGGRDLSDALDAIIKKSLEGVNHEEFLKEEDNEDESVIESVEGNNDS